MRTERAGAVPALWPCLLRLQPRPNTLLITHCSSDHLHLLSNIEAEDADCVAHLVLEVGGENQLVVILHALLTVRLADELTGEDCAGHGGTSHTRVAQLLLLLPLSRLSCCVFSISSLGVTDGQEPLRTGR